MKWILIFMLFGRGETIIVQEFDSASACNDARIVLVNANAMREAKGYCFPKG